MFRTLTALDKALQAAGLQDLARDPRTTVYVRTQDETAHHYLSHSCKLANLSVSGTSKLTYRVAARPLPLGELLEDPSRACSQCETDLANPTNWNLHQGSLALLALLEAHQVTRRAQGHVRKLEAGVATKQADRSRLRLQEVRRRLAAIAGPPEAEARLRAAHEAATETIAALERAMQSTTGAATAIAALQDHVMPDGLGDHLDFDQTDSVIAVRGLYPQNKTLRTLIAALSTTSPATQGAHLLRGPAYVADLLNRLGGLTLAQATPAADVTPDLVEFLARLWDPSGTTPMYNLRIAMEAVRAAAAVPT